MNIEIIGKKAIKIKFLIFVSIEIIIIIPIKEFLEVVKSEKYTSKAFISNKKYF